ncbi:Xylulose kinase [Psilocybe cubensis]|uniref:Xylulose kinase n=2 Tax=Psilocybe cubensis TaxID=181762 RepID=A0ACB8GV46_PSICU|nr:Xylulose kinase [Psilocybe cubensis]KAH9479446.1 Xylulose kinase [Psilocybe cubensis]
MSSAAPSKPLFLGLDLSTQQLKAVLLDEESNVVHEAAVHFDRDLPHHGTTNGAILGPDDGEVTSPVKMWLEAIDLLCERLSEGKIDFGAIAAVSGAGQQHGSVFWSSDSDSLLASLDSSKSLTEQLFPAAFASPKAPIWQDSSTTVDCKRLEDEFGGAQAVADVSGSRAYERFTGNQISRIRRLKPDVYEASTHISLVSSFITSVFLGRIAPIDISDASGMNLMDVLSCKWDQRLLEICGGPTLRAKLGEEPVIGGTSLGPVSSWWVKKWGFNPECIVAPFTGDNPATVMSLSAPGDALLSLGTSTTFLLSIPHTSAPPKRFTTSHLLAHPTDFDGKIAMLCYKNGALAREQIRDRFANGDWDKFNQLIQQTPPGCNGNLGFYFPLPEIIPPNVTGEFFFTTDLVKTTVKPPLPTENVPPTIHPRAIVESQFLSIRSRIAAMLPKDSPHLKRLVISGGSSQNLVIRQLLADIFDMDVYVSATKEAAASGGALLAKYAWWKRSHPEGTFEDMTAGEAMGLQCVANPNKEISAVYNDLVSVYDACEAQVVDSWAAKN